MGGCSGRAAGGHRLLDSEWVLETSRLRATPAHPPSQPPTVPGARRALPVHGQWTACGAAWEGCLPPGSRPRALTAGTHAWLLTCALEAPASHPPPAPPQKLTYTDDTPDEYEPPMFAPAADGGVGCFSRMPFTMWVLGPGRLDVHMAASSAWLRRLWPPLTAPCCPAPPPPTPPTGRRARWTPSTSRCGRRPGAATAAVSDCHSRPHAALRARTR